MPGQPDQGRDYREVGTTGGYSGHRQPQTGHGAIYTKVKTMKHSDLASGHNVYG